MTQHIKQRYKPIHALMLALALLLAMSSLLPVPALADTGDQASTATPCADCRFVLGFESMHNLLADSGVVGSCLEDEYHTPDGDGFQRTTNGLMIWKKASNWTAFTNGEYTWINGPFGLQRRAATDQFAWEAALPDATPDAVSFLTTPQATLPELMDVSEVARYIEVAHRANGGSTFNLYFGDLAGEELYAVSLYPDLSVLVEGQPTLDDLQSFIIDNYDLLRDPRVSVGTWYNSENGMTYLDISATIPDKETAIALGKEYNQLAIFSLATFEEISTGGTGEAIAGLPPVLDRLTRPEWN
ncbi:MAG: hypothetical protein GX552_01455 [Chloroflexi bacterium]|jgi:hypothetical protein|nr:hypothetical protein [Chloroflexota bacterium]